MRKKFVIAATVFAGLVASAIAAFLVLAPQDSNAAVAAEPPDPSFTLTNHGRASLADFSSNIPIIVLRTQMQQEGQLTDDEFTKLDEEVKAIVQDAWDFADQSPEPPVEALFEDVLVDTTSDAHAEAAVAAD